MIVHQVQELNSVSVLMITASVTIEHHAYNTALSMSAFESEHTGDVERHIMHPCSVVQYSVV
eukprot:18638-Heterococcus_DN1.PRE.4